MRSFRTALLAAVCLTSPPALRAQAPLPPAGPTPPVPSPAQRGGGAERADFEVASALGLWNHIGAGEHTESIDAAWRAADTKAALEIAAAMLAADERDATGHIVRYLALLELAQDRQRARIAAVQATKALAEHPAALATFIDKALFVTPEANEYQLALLALTPVLADARKDISVRITHIQALLGCGKNREAFVTNKDIVKEFAGDPQALRRIAAGICDAPNGISLAPLARRAFDLAIKDEARNLDDRILEFRILNDLEGNPKAAAPVAEAILTEVSGRQLGLNNWIWYTMVRRGTRGKLDSIALPAAEKMIETGEADEFHTVDTVALAFFVNGKLDKALEYQERAVRMAGLQASKGMLRRLEIFRAAARPARPVEPRPEGSRPEG